MNSLSAKDKISPRKSSLSRRFSMTFSIVVSTILLLFCTGVVFYNSYTLEKELIDQLNGTLELAETSLPTAVWQMDYSSMNDVLEAILINDTIASVRISTDGEIAAKKTQPQYRDIDFSFFRNSSEFTVKSVDVSRFGEKVGVFEVAISHADVDRELIVTLLVVISLAVILCSAILLTSVFITRRYIFQPLIRLENHAELIAGGDLETHIEATGNDEFAQLASAFNIMADQLKISFQTLEQKVQERTADLFQAKNEAEKMNLHLGVIGAELQTLLDNSPVGIVFVDFDRIIQRVNPEITRITGYTGEDLIGQTTRVLYGSEESYRSFGEAQYPFLRENGYCQANTEFVRKDGIPVTCYLRGRIIVAESGIEGIVWTVEDITMRLKMEDELLKIKKLESIGVFAGGIAHDFNNLLLAIIGNISLAKRIAAHSNQLDELLTSAHKASERARELTAKLLTFASGGEPIKSTESLPQLLEDSASFVLSGSNVKCVYEFSADLWHVNMDKTQINQVIQNLVLNADQSMPDGGVLSISCSNEHLAADQIPGLNSGHYVRVSVRDRGHGITKENIDRIFDPYFSTKVKDSSKGSGLGLAIVHSIISKHGGSITVESVPEKGSDFILYLPAMPICDARDIAVEESPHMSTGRILVMDDEEMIREVVCNMLNHLGYDASAAADGDEAVSAYKNSQESGHPFDAVIMDLTIPGGMGGVEAVQHILAIDAQAKVIVSSGYSQDPILDDYHAFGFCNIVSKPYQLIDLPRVLAEVIREGSNL
jgi:PAS domain S-box-containing protein